MFNTAPRHIPPLALILDDLGQPSSKTLATFLDVHERTVQRWVANDTMPRPAQLALFWLTRWGRSIVDAEAVNDARQYAGLAEARRTEADELRLTLSRVLAVADFGSSNQPTYRYGTTAQSIEPASPERGPATPARQSLRLVSRSKLGAR